MIKKLFSIAILIFLFSLPSLAHQPQIVTSDKTVIKDPEISRAFYDTLTGAPRTYFIESPKDYELYLGLLVPKSSNPNGRYSAKVYRINGKRQIITALDQDKVKWAEYYEEFAGDYYIKGPDFKQQLPAGKYEIVVFNHQNQGKYVLAVGEKEAWPLGETIRALALLPKLKISFFNTSVFKLLVTPMGILYWIGLALLIIIFFIIRKLFRV